jgi:asparagine synthase (glutamine-hydrolysing)
MVKHIDSHHTYLECSNQNQIDCLFQAVDARDMPSMADVESSMLYFCSLVAKECKVTLTGECADEIFGGYPWFHRKEMLYQNTFPWSYDMETRTYLFKDEFVHELNIKEYVNSKYMATLNECPELIDANEEERHRRQICYLNIRWFMMTLLNRMDRCSMYSGLEARVPYADYRILQYVFNVPWSYKCYNGQAKSLLVECGKKYLPDEILYRKKSPYPKTYDPNYEKILGNMVMSEYESNKDLQYILDKKKLEAFISSPKDYGKPWYGQLMAGPQMLAYILQIGEWLKKYSNSY